MHKAENNAFFPASGAKGDPLLRKHLKPQPLGENDAPRVCTNTATLLNLYLGLQSI